MYQMEIFTLIQKQAFSALTSARHSTEVRNFQVVQKVRIMFYQAYTWVAST